MRFAVSLAGAALGACVAFNAVAATDGFVQPDQPGVRFYTFAENEIYNLTAYYKYVTTIFIGRDEKIKTANAGDAEAWDISIPESANYVSIKPIVRPARASNLVITTTKDRVYTFSLAAADAPRADVVTQPVHFDYRAVGQDVLAALAQARQDLAAAQTALPSTLPCSPPTQRL